MLSASLLEGIKAHFFNLTVFGYFSTIIDILIVAVLIYYAFVLIKGTRATQIIYGILVLIFILILGRFLRLQTLNWFLQRLTTLILVAIPIVFQPELRRGLERLGRIKFFKASSLFSSRPYIIEKVINEITEAVSVLLKNKVGGLICIKRETGLGDFIEKGEVLWARLSAKLLLNIFYPNSPLHDGAVIICGERIAAAGCVLPLSEDKKGYMYGTRHRAALGLSEETDAVCIVISEEKRAISLVVEGKIQQVSLDELGKKLAVLLKEK